MNYYLIFGNYCLWSRKIGESEPVQGLFRRYSLIPLLVSGEVQVERRISTLEQVKMPGAVLLDFCITLMQFTITRHQYCYRRVRGYILLHMSNTCTYV